VRTFAGGVKAVQGVDLEVAEGEIYAFLGPNGAGKTTTVRMLTTLLKPTAGSATVAGFDVVKEPAKVRRAIGVALQEAALDPLMTGRELMQLQATLHGIPKAEARRRGDELIARVGLTNAADFLDEPTTGLDPASRAAIWDEVRKLNDEGTTVFLTTQYLEEADQLADRVGIIDEGFMAAEGTPRELKAQVGKPRLELTLAEGSSEVCQKVLDRFGEPLPPKDGVVVVALEQGAAGIAPIIRALDEAGIAVQDLHLVQPTLDDVFLEKTGRHLEGADAEEPQAEPQPEPA